MKRGRNGSASRATIGSVVLPRRLLVLLLLVGLAVIQGTGAFAFLPTSRKYSHTFPAFGTKERLPGLFAPKTSTTTTTTRRAMISQKEKRRLAEEQERTSALQQTEILKQQRILVSQMREIMAGNKKAAPAAVKLLKQVAHDGLADIGEEARGIVLRLFYHAKRPADVLGVLGSATTSTTANLAKEGTGPSVKEKTTLYSKYALWAHSQQEDWSSAAAFVIPLYGNEELTKKQGNIPEILESADGNKDLEDSAPFASDQEQEQLRQLAVQALAYSGQNLTLARQLLQPTIDPDSLIYAMFQAYRHKGVVADATSLWDELDTAAAVDKMNGCYSLLLEWGSEAGNIPWMERAMDGIKTPSKNHKEEEKPNHPGAVELENERDDQNEEDERHWHEPHHQPYYGYRDTYGHRRHAPHNYAPHNYNYNHHRYGNYGGGRAHGHNRGRGGYGRYGW
jgi:hypothetical protein